MSDMFKQIIGRCMACGIEFELFKASSGYFIRDKAHTPKLWEIDDIDECYSNINLWVEDDFKPYSYNEAYHYTDHIEILLKLKSS